MQRKSFLFLIIILLLSLSGCGAPAPEMATVERFVEAPAAAPSEPDMAAADQSTASGGASEEGVAQPLLDATRKIIYRAGMSLEVDDIELAMQQIEDLVAAAGGYVADSQLSQYSSDQMRGFVSLRVPAERYGDLRVQLRQLALRVIGETSNAQDVTEEFTDLEARLRNLEAAEQELLALLREVRERPNAKAEDILAVFDALTQKRGEIEQVKGRMQYLSNLTAFSTIDVELVPSELGRPVVEEGWQPLVTLKNAFRTLVTLLQGLVDLLINLLVVVLPVLIIIALPIVALIFALRWLMRRRRGQR